MNKMSIVVPYRDREDHFKQFIPHMLDFFSRRDQGQPEKFCLIFVEQAGTGLLNRGMLRNVGYLLTKDLSDWVCFHDIDYLPRIANYTCPDNPTRAIWHGAATRPLFPGGEHLIKHDYQNFFGGVVLFRHEHFQGINGYSNQYWGWGFEDTDLRLRCLAAGHTIDLRDGSFEPLNHVNNGFEANGQVKAEAVRNSQRFQLKAKALKQQRVAINDGLSTCKFTVEREAVLVNPRTGEALPHVTKVLVRLAGEPD